MCDTNQKKKQKNICLQSKNRTFWNVWVAEVKQNFYFEGGHSQVSLQLRELMVSAAPSLQPSAITHQPDRESTLFPVTSEAVNI